MHYTLLKIPHAAIISTLMLTVLVSIFLTACEQYNPRPWRQTFHQERQQANKAILSLNAKGEIVEPQDPEESAADPITQKYNSFCAACHGQDGKANSELILAMNPKPRSFTDGKWQSQVSDEHILKVIKEGGAAVELSNTMAPWGAVLSETELQEMVRKVRSFHAQTPAP